MYSQIIVNGTTYGPDDIIDATYTHIVNSGEQLNVGVVASAQLVVRTREQWANGTAITYKNRPFNTGSYDTKGLFIIKDVTKQKDIYTYTGYDYLCKLDTIVDSWWAGLTWPKTLAQLFNGVATACGLTADTNFDGAPSSVSKPNFSAVNLRGRQIVQWIAQIAGGFAYAKTTGMMAIRHYGVTSVHGFSPSEYAKLDIKNYVVPAPDWIQVAKNNNGDVWNYTTQGVGTTGTNLIKIMGNPFTWGDDYTQTAANYCFNIISHGWIPSYTPYTIKVYQDYGVSAGDQISINGVTSIVMNKKIDKSGVTFSSVGLQVRNETTELQQQQIVYQSPQEWFDQGVTNSSGTDYRTGYIYYKGEGTLYDDVEAQFGINKGWPNVFVAQSGNGGLYSESCDIQPRNLYLSIIDGPNSKQLTLGDQSTGRGLHYYDSQTGQRWSITNEGVTGLGGCGTWDNTGGTIYPIANITGSGTSTTKTFKNDLHYKAFILVLSLGRGDPDFMDSIYVPRLVFQRGHGGGAATVNLYSSLVKANGSSYPPLIPDSLKKCGDVSIALANNNSQNSTVTINTQDNTYLIEVYGVYT